MMSPTPSRPVGDPSELGGSWLMGAVYSMGFYIALSLVMTLGEGFGGLVGWAWVLVVVAWAVTAIRLAIPRASRKTGIGMIGFVAVMAVVFALVGALLSLVVRH
ncbi:MAG TPA: hypothetical protein PKX10_08160 [Propioniciclava tarda]|nr:hypothetical protein [Propioniciclava tarda]HQA31377.1 hypothetical protein [Propioniciclava tarda]HQD60940.1 hypothetical protein [Propioniciclava tarda]